VPGEERATGDRGPGASSLASWRALLQLPQGRLEQRANLYVSESGPRGGSPPTPCPSAGGRADGLPTVELDLAADRTPPGGYHRRAHAFCGLIQSAHVLPSAVDGGGAPA